MRFRLKLALSMLCLMSILFGLCGSLLISGSFADSLDRERQTAYGSYQSVLGMLQLQMLQNEKITFSAAQPAALLVALGLFLPQLAAAHQERGLAGEVRRMENAAVSLTLAEELVELAELDLFQSLELFSSHITMVELEEGQHTSAEYAVRITGELMEYFGLDAYSDGDESSPAEAVPFLLTDKEGRSGIFWRCSWEERPDEEVWIDDQNGSLVGFRLRTTHLLPEIVCHVICDRFFPPNIDANVFRADSEEACIRLYNGEKTVDLGVYHAMEDFHFFNIFSGTSTAAMNTAE